jgi:hypothetical protein
MKSERFYFRIGLFIILLVVQQTLSEYVAEENPLEPIFKQMRGYGFEILKNEAQYVNFMYREGFDLAIHFQPSCPQCKQLETQFPGLQSKINVKFFFQQIPIILEHSRCKSPDRNLNLRS